MSNTLGMNITSSTCVITGADVLKQQGITQLSKWNCLWITVAWGFFFRFLFYLSLLFGSKNKRRGTNSLGATLVFFCPYVELNYEVVDLTTNLSDDDDDHVA
ncbi:ABC transporter G family member 20 [Spatholobus suberectus]|nr:ABC transporter G family member 20 [Spatholobus suberectus]